MSVLLKKIEVYKETKRLQSNRNCSLGSGAKFCFFNVFKVIKWFTVPLKIP